MLAQTAAAMTFGSGMDLEQKNSFDEPGSYDLRSAPHRVGDGSDDALAPSPAQLVENDTAPATRA